MKFKVNFNGHTTVEADNEDEAMDKVYDLLQNIDWVNIECELNGQEEN